MSGPKQHHIDRRAHKLVDEAGNDDELLPTRIVAAWLGVSTLPFAFKF